FDSSQRGSGGSKLCTNVVYKGMRSSTSSPRKNRSSTRRSFSRSPGFSSPHNLRYDLLRLSALRLFGNRVHHPLGQLAERKSGLHWSSTEQERLSICTVSSRSRLAQHGHCVALFKQGFGPHRFFLGIWTSGFQRFVNRKQNRERGE